MAQGLSYNVYVERKGENNHNITVYSEKETCCSLQLIWAISFESKKVMLDSLEQLAGLAAAKALGGRGERGLEDLDIAVKQKEVVKLLNGQGGERYGCCQQSWWSERLIYGDREPGRRRTA